ncbi:hypothetical protein Tco_0628863 [Tanacetum coccineum]|uniref:Uncharacterized protein n=1 Tax=Tanacetum coccineum TaxID=301880 RepID=A0ABQ4WSA3_9ASTR
MSKGKKDKNRVFVVNLKHDGIYSPYPFPYIHGDEKQLTDFDFEVRKTLKQGLCPLGNDPDVQEFLKAGYKDEHFDPNPESEPELYRNRTDSRNNGNFRGFINEHIPVNEDLNIEDLDSSSLEPRHQIQRGIASPRHDPLQPWNEMQPILGMRYDHLDQLKLPLANYRVEDIQGTFLKKLKLRNSYSHSGRGQDRGGMGRGRGVTTMLVDEEEMNEHNQVKRKVAEPSAAEPPFRIYHKSRGRSERIFNQKMKKTGLGPNGEGFTADKAFSL